MPFRLIRHVLLRVAQVGSSKRALLIEAALGLLEARLTLLVVPFPRLARRFGSLAAPTDSRMSKEANMNHDQARIAEGVGWAVTRAARYVPFRAVCLPQAIAAQKMLRRRGVASRMHFGVMRERETKLFTHAWLDAAGVEVTGNPVTNRFAEIACFVCGEP